MDKIIYCLVALMISSGFVSASEVYLTDASALSSVAKLKKEYRTVVYDVHLHCENCVKKVKENISFEKGVKALEVSLENQKVTVTYDTSKTDEKKIAEAIRKLGYEVKSAGDGK
ncbi:MAG: heavy-metal-associated domain-containing protein [Bacteroidales bacterium]|nr:heavy-metal-associated domain-containing protein [Bacteroidales bacterium]